MLLSDAVGAVRAVRLLLLSDVGLLLSGAVRCCQVVLSGCCQALTHTSHTYDTIKRRPAGLYYAYSQPLLLKVHGVITPAGRLGSAYSGAGAGGGGGTDGGGHPTQTPRHI